MAVSVKWLGHAAFALNIDDKHILIDPFLTGNPLAAADADSIDADLILLSHGHGDHIGDSIAISQRTGAPIITNVEVSRWLQKHGAEHTVGGNTGGTYDAGFVRVKWTIAFHSSGLPDGNYGGMPNGFLITLPSGRKLYFAGDTSLFGDMALIGEEGVEVAMLPVGDFFTMGIDDSIRAINLIRPRFVTPMHYNTFPPIVQNISEWANRVNSETDATPIVVDPGGTFTVE